MWCSASLYNSKALLINAGQYVNEPVLERGGVAAQQAVRRRHCLPRPQAHSPQHGTRVTSPSRLTATATTTINNSNNKNTPTHAHMLMPIPTQGQIELPYAWDPSVVPLQLMRVGQLVIVATPAEFTTMAGRRYCLSPASHHHHHNHHHDHHHHHDQQ